MTVYRTAKISELTADSSLSGTETFVVAQGGQNYKVTLADLLAYVNANRADISIKDLTEWSGDGFPGGVVYFDETAGAYAERSPFVAQAASGSVALTAGTLAVPSVWITATDNLVFTASDTAWEIGVEHRVTQGGVGRVNVGLDASVGLTLLGVDHAGAVVDTVTGETVAALRTTGQGAMATIVRLSATLFLFHGNIEVVP